MLTPRYSLSLVGVGVILSASSACSGAVELRGEVAKEWNLAGAEIALLDLDPTCILLVCEVYEPPGPVGSIVDFRKTRYLTGRGVYLARCGGECSISRYELTSQELKDRDDGTGCWRCYRCLIICLLWVVDLSVRSNCWS